MNPWPSTLRRLFLAVTCSCVAFGLGSELLARGETESMADGAMCLGLAVVGSITAGMAVAALMNDESKAAMIGCMVAWLCLLLAALRFL